MQHLSSHLRAPEERSLRTHNLEESEIYFSILFSRNFNVIKQQREKFKKEIEAQFAKHGLGTTAKANIGSELSRCHIRFKLWII